MSEVREGLTRFCRLELDIDDAEECYKAVYAPLAATRTRAHSMLTRVMMDESTPWVRLTDGKYLHHHNVKSQVSLNEEVVRVAATRAVRELCTNPGTDIEDARAKLLEFLRRELRLARSTSTPSIKLVTKLPRSVESAEVPSASTYILEHVEAWCGAKDEIVRARDEYTRTVTALRLERENALNAPGVRDYLTGVGAGGQLVTLAGQEGKKFKLRHTVSTRRNPMRESHVQDALENAVNMTLVDDMSSVSSHKLIETIMKEVVRLVGTTTTDVFSLTSQRGRKRASEE